MGRHVAGTRIESTLLPDAMWFKNLKIYRLSAPWTLTGEQLEESLARHAYQAGNNLEMQSLGWVSPRENAALSHTVNQQILLSLRAEKKLLPATVVNQVARARAQELEEQQRSEERRVGKECVSKGRYRGSPAN